MTLSILDTTSNSVIGELKSCDKYALTSRPISAEGTEFDHTIQRVRGERTDAGERVIQMFWDARRVDQTYESCVDLTDGDRCGSSDEGDASSSSAAPVATTSARASVSSAVASASSSSVVITSSAASEIKVVNNTMPVTSMSVTGAPGTSATGDVFSLEAATVTMAWREELWRA